MTALTTTQTVNLGPISSDWTIGELLQWLEDDARTHDRALREPLARVEAAVTGAPWQAAPSTVALVRSLAEACRSGNLSGVRIAHVVPDQAGMEHAERFEPEQRQVA